MNNAKDEFLDFIKFCRDKWDMNLEAAEIWTEEYCSEPEYPDIFLKLYPDYTESEFNDMLDKLNFNYIAFDSDDDPIKGYIWFTNGAWAERSNIDDIPYWELYRRPDIPER